MKRSEQKTADTWNLDALCVDTADFRSRYEKISASVSRLAAYNGRLREGSDTIHEFLTLMKETGIEAERISSYAFLRFEADGGEAENQELAGLASNLEARLMQALSWFEPEILSLDRKILDAFLAEERAEEYRIYILKILRAGEHTLSKAEERILSLNAEASGACQKAFQDLSDVDMEFGEVNGRKLTQSSYMSLIRDPDENVRKEAYLKFYQGFEKHQHVIARLYEGSVNQDIFQARARGYASSLEAALFPDNVPESVYRNLIDSVHRGFPILHRYYDLMARVHGKDKLKHWDVYVPLVKDVPSRHTYEEAVKLIEKAVEPLGKEYQKILVKGLTTERWVDRYENDGKRSGAFSAGCYTGNPYILTNFNEDVLNSVFTLIHEGGHSMHSYYSVKSNPFMHYNYTIFEAEVASTFNEQLLARHLLSVTQDEKARAFIIAQQLADMVGTLFRQTMFAEYELLVHEAVERGEVATVDFMRKTYRSLLVSYFGPKMEFEDVSDLEGLRIPHFYRAFYVYKYATGISAAIALSDRVLGGGEKERDDYISFLKSGGSRYPIESLKLGGVDMSGPEGVDSAVRRFDELLTELEKLI
ncbi:MAG: oligoendopeptidase F [Bullifex sp.]